MPTKMIGQRKNLWWVKSTAGVAATIPAGTISKATWDTGVTAGDIIDLSAAIAEGYTLNPTGSDTDDTRMVTDVSNVERRSGYNYEGSMQFAREADTVTNTTSIFEKAFQLFKAGGVNGFWVRRTGYLYTTALATGHKLDAFQFVSDLPRDVETDGGGPIWLEVPYRPSGVMKLNIAVSA